MDRFVVRRPFSSENQGQSENGERPQSVSQSTAQDNTKAVNQTGAIQGTEQPKKKRKIFDENRNFNELWKTK